MSPNVKASDRRDYMLTDKEVNAMTWDELMQWVKDVYNTMVERGEIEDDSNI